MDAMELLSLRDRVTHAEDKASKANTEVWNLERLLKDAQKNADSLRFMAEEYAEELRGIENDIREGKEVKMPYWY